MTVIIEKNVDAKMRDGTILRADVFRPAADGQYPVLLQRTPYNKEFYPFTYAALDPIRAAAAGYVVVIQDVRGRWASDGDTFFLYRNEFEDGHDSVEWASKLPWSDGTAGVYGMSYMGGATWQAAYGAPEALKAIAPTTAPDNFHSHLWRGGALQLGLLVSWALAAGANALVRSKAGSEDFFPMFLRLVDDIDGFESAVRFMPIKSLPATRPEDPDFLPFYREVLEHPTLDDFNRSTLRYEKHESVRVPAQIVAGWHDILLRDDLSHFNQMRSQAANEVARDKTRLIVGPWVHPGLQGSFTSVVGEFDFGMRSSGLFIDLREDLTGLTMRWFDRWLKGIGNGIDQEARVKIFVQGINRWRDEDDWPLQRAVSTPWYLGTAGSLSPAAPPSDSDPDVYLYDPQDPCPTTGGSLLMPYTYQRGPVDQRGLLDRNDVLAFTSQALSEDLEVTGPVKAVIHASTSAPDTDWVVKLCDVHPDGRTFNVCDGILRASYRHSMESRTLVEPNSVERYEIDLWATSMVFKAGHRLRLLITSSDFPRYDRNPNTGEIGVDAERTEIARQTIFHDAQNPSHLLLPLIPN
jgi:putative CocE/NonD family hydrolase